MVKRLLLFCFLIVILILLVKNSTPLTSKPIIYTKPPQLMSQQQNTALIVPTSTVNTSTWKTYTNTKYNFSFKYPDQPAGAKLRLLEVNGTEGFNGEEGLDHVTLRRIDKRFEDSFMIGISPKSAAEFIQRRENPPADFAKYPILKKEGFVVDGKTGTELVLAIGNPNWPEDTSIYLENNGNTFIFSYGPGLTGTDFNNILSTFKFLP